MPVQVCTIVILQLYKKQKWYFPPLSDLFIKTNIFDPGYAYVLVAAGIFDVNCLVFYQQNW